MASKYARLNRMIQLQKVLGSVRHECKYLVQERGDSKVTAVPQI
jgi:hypothetical protein